MLLATDFPISPQQMGSAAVAEALDMLLYNTSEGSRAAAAFSLLEQNCLFLGNGCFLLALLEGAEEKPDTVRQVLEAGGQLPANRLLLRSCGQLWLLVCFPRFREPEELPEALLQDTEEALGQLLPACCSAVFLSRVIRGEQGIYPAASALRRLRDYHRWLGTASGLISLPAASARVPVGISLDRHRAHIASLTAELQQPAAEPEELAARVLAGILEEVPPAVPMVNAEVRSFLILLAEQLISEGHMDAAFFERQYSRMPASTESADSLQAYLADCFRTLRHQRNARGDREMYRLMQRVNRYAAEHITDYSLSVRTVCQEFGISPSTMNRNFQKYYGITLLRFIRETRTDCARRLILEHPDWSMQQVAQAAGYNDLTTMYRAFQAVLQMSPAKFRAGLGL